MAGGIDGPAHGGNIGRHAGAGFIVDYAHRLDLVLSVLFQAGLDHVGADATAPAFDAWQADELWLEPQTDGHLLPEAGEMTGLEHQHLITCTQGIAQRGLPGARARGRVDDHRVAGLEDLLDAREHLEAELAELGAAVIDGGVAHGAKDTVGHRAGPGDLQEVTAGRMEIELEHGVTLCCCILNAKLH